MPEEQWCCLYAKQAASDGGPVVHDSQCTATRTVTVFQRRICWPKPDATCLEGGCGYCNHEPWRNLSTIERYARKAGIVPNRATGEQDAWAAYRWGLERDFCNAETRTIEKKVKA